MAKKGRAAPVAEGEGYVRLESVDLPRQAAPARPRLEPQAAAAVRAFVPAAIRSRLDAGHSDWLAELRRVQPTISLEWVANEMPFKHAKDRESYLAGFRRAGLG